MPRLASWGKEAGGTLSILNSATGERLYRLPPHSNQLYGLTWSPDGTRS